MTPNQRSTRSAGATTDIVSSDLRIADATRPYHPERSRETFRLLVRHGRGLRNKRKPADTNEGRNASEDRKRARTSYHAASDILALSLDPCPTKDGAQKVGGRHAQHNGFEEGEIQLKLNQSMKRLSFPPPRLAQPDEARNVSPRTRRQLRNLSYERRLGGNLFTIYEDETATSDPAYVHRRTYTSRMAYTRSRARHIYEWDQGQENMRRGSNTVELRGSTDEERELPMPVPQQTTPSREFQTPTKAMFTRLTAAAKVLRMMR